MGKRGINATVWAPPDGEKEGSGWANFEFLIGCQCTAGELVGYYNVSEKTIRRAVKRQYKMSFDQLLEQKRSRGKASLRRVSWQLALSGDKTMIIWLSKQHLGMVDKLVTEQVGTEARDASKQVSEAIQKFSEMLKEISKPKEDLEKEEKKMGLLSASLGLRD